MGSQPSVPATPQEFGPKTTGAQVADVLVTECANKTVLITGANTGLGLETARVLATNGATVVIACRTPSKGNAAVATILAECPSASVSFLPLDLASLASIRSFAADFSTKFNQLHILINNAGVMACPKTPTADGLETQFGVNHVGHFYLTKLLLPTLTKTGTAATPARVINLASLAQYLFAPEEGILFGDINGDKSYSPWTRYGHAKLANVLFSNELNRRYQDQHVISVSLHPGSIPSSELSRYMGPINALGAITALRWGMTRRLVCEKMKS
ncbi:WW domain-containing oxidoreductase-like isoform 1, partial [Achlya hypogyna]